MRRAAVSSDGVGSPGWAAARPVPYNLTSINGRGQNHSGGMESPPLIASGLMTPAQCCGCD